MNAEESPKRQALHAEPIAALIGVSRWTDKFTARDPSDSLLELAAMDHSSNADPASAPSTIGSVAEVRNSLAHTPVFPRKGPVVLWGGDVNLRRLNDRLHSEAHDVGRVIAGPRV